MSRAEHAHCTPELTTSGASTSAHETASPPRRQPSLTYRSAANATEQSARSQEVRDLAEHLPQRERLRAAALVQRALVLLPREQALAVGRAQAAAPGSGGEHRRRAAGRAGGRSSAAPAAAPAAALAPATAPVAASAAAPAPPAALSGTADRTGGRAAR